MKWLVSTDQRLIGWLEDVYLWIWDRTGVYIGSLIFCAYVGDHVCWGPLKSINFFCIACSGAVCGQRYAAQLKDLRLLNDLQRMWRDLAWRRWFSILVFNMLVLDMITTNVWHFSSDFLMLLWSYLGCVQVREREPKEFVSHPKLARAGA